MEGALYCGLKQFSRLFMSMAAWTVVAPRVCVPVGEEKLLLQAAIQDGQFAILAKSIYWKLMRHK